MILNNHNSKRTLSIVFICLILLIGCDGKDPLKSREVVIPTKITGHPTETGWVTPTTTQISEPIRTPTPTSSTAAIVEGLEGTPTPIPTYHVDPTQYPSLVLPGNLHLDEYPMKVTFSTTENILARYPQRGNMIPYSFHNGEYHGSRFEAFEITESSMEAKIQVIVGGTQTFTIDCGPRWPQFIITAGGDENDWFIEAYCNKKLDIIKNGKSLIETRGYEEAFAFQILNDSPFYLFRKDGHTWLFYKDQEVQLNYDQILFGYCCEVAPAPLHYEHLIAFFAKRGKQEYYVVLSGD